MNEMEIHEKFWRRQFPRPVELPALPFGGLRPPVPSYLRESVGLTLDRPSSEDLCGFSSRLEVMPQAVLLAALKTVLFRYVGQETLIVGAAAQIVNAPRVLSSPLLPIQTHWDVQADVSGERLVREVAQSIAEANTHAAYPLRELQTWAGAQDAAFGSRLFNIALCWSDTPLAVKNGWPISDPLLGEFLTQCDVVIIAALNESGISLKADFDADLFETTSLRRFLGHLGIILNGFVGNPGASVLRLPILAEDERKELLEDFNHSAVPLNPRRLPLDGTGTLHQLFETQAARTPDAVALTCDGVNLTYVQLNAQANRLARVLQGLGVGPDVLVGLCLERSSQLVIGLLAILKAGGAYLPIDLAYPAERLAFMLEDARTPLLLTQTKLTKDLPATAARVLCVDELLDEAPRADAAADLPPAAGPDNLAYVIYTSGTTGKPKGSLITHRNVTRLFAATDHWYGFNEQDVWTLFHSCAFDFSVWEIWGALLYGGRLVVVPYLVSRSPEAFYELLAAERVTVLNQTPSAFRQLIQAEAETGQKPLALRYVTFGGEALEMQSLRPWFERHGDQTPLLVNMYGITETTVHVTYRPLSKDDLNSGSVIGVPIPDLQIYILDAQRQLVPIGVPGEMYVGGAGLARGYLHRPELTAERFVPDHLSERPDARLYKTGDLVRFLPDRDIEYLGRIDHQVKIRGFRIELGEIESVLCQHTSVREAIVLAREDGAGGKRLVGYVVTATPSPAVSELREHLRKKLPDYMVPAAFVFLDKLPLTNNGKVDRQALPEPEQDRPELAAAFIAPRNELEVKLAEIWSRALRVERVGIHDNFFELGGDSILSIQIISIARQAGVSLTPKLIFQHPTIAGLAASATPVTAPRKVEPGLVQGRAPLTPIQHWFLEQNLTDAQWYNQACLFVVREPLKPEVLELALVHLEKQHDALRLRLLENGQTGESSFAAPNPKLPLEWIDLSGVATDDLAATLQDLGQAAQATLDVVNGPLWRVVYCDLGAGRLSRLLLVIHHLAVDGVSWRILLEDLESAYDQLEQGRTVDLPPKTTSVKEWAEQLATLAKQLPPFLGPDHWRNLANQVYETLPVELHDGENTEDSSETIVLRLEPTETEALLKNAPTAYKTQINDLLLSALGPALSQWTGLDSVHINLEGHGREDLFETADLSRTVGWFTSIFPVQLSIPNSGDTGTVIKAVKEQLRSIPARGIGYGILRYLARDEQLRTAKEPEILFNYLGQLDQLLEGSHRFGFAAENTGAWHSPRQNRRHLIEINCAVMRQQFEISWTYSRNRHREGTMRALASSFLRNLREVVHHCTSVGKGGFTPSDFPLAALDQPAVDRLLTRVPDLEDVYPLAPVQALFYSVGVQDARAVTDQWHCTLNGPLNIEWFRAAWQQLVARHSVLRTSFHSTDLKEPLQVVHARLELPWSFEDWRGVSPDEQEKRWQALLQREREQGLVLDQSPLHRIKLIQLRDQQARFVWSAPALLLDGWSWPVVFRDLSNLYGSLSGSATAPLLPARPYRDCVAWLRRRREDEDEQYWRKRLQGVTHPTPLIAEAGDLPAGTRRESGEFCQTIDAATTARLVAFARQLRITPNTLILAAWSLALSRLSGRADVVFGAAFSGRPTELQDSGNIVGPFVNNLPVRISVEKSLGLEDYLKGLHNELLELNLHQFAPLAQIQSWSEVPWRDRLFESLVVVQNYEVDESARRIGDDVSIADFCGPIHTNFPLLVLVEPGTTWRITLIHDRRELAAARVAQWGQDLVATLGALPDEHNAPLARLFNGLSEPAVRLAPKPRFRVQSLNYVPPQTEFQRLIAKVWQEMFQIERISIEDNLFDLGAHSLLVTRLHERLREALGREISLVDLFRFPTVGSLAAHFEVRGKESSNGGIRSRAQQQREALARLRRPVAQK